MKNPLLIIGLTLALATVVAQSATVGSEDGSQYTTGTWVNGVSGNISNWYINTGVGAATNISNSNLAGRTSIGASAFFIVGNSPGGTYLDVYKPLGSALLVGQSVILDANYLWNGGVQGIEFQDNGGTGNLFRLEHGFGSDALMFKGVGITDTQVAANAYQQAYSYTITALSLTSVQVKATLYGSPTALLDQTVTVTALPNQIHFYAGGSGDTTPANFDNYGLYFNNLQVTTVPEPSTFALLGLGLAAFALRRKVKVS